MAYYTKVLQPEEHVLAIGRLHWSIYGRAVLILLVAAAVAIGSFWLADQNWQRIARLGAAAIAVIGLLALLGAAIRRHATEIVVTDKRVIYKRGILSRYTVEMHTSKIETVDVDQSVMGRLFGYGTVEVRGTGSGIEPLRHIGHPLQIRNAIIAG